MVRESVDSPEFNHIRYSDMEFTVDQILDSRVTYNGKIEYLCKWKDFAEEDNTWELEEKLNCHELIYNFKVQRSIKNRKRKAQIKENQIYETKAKKLKLDSSIVILNAFDCGHEAASILSASMAFDRIRFLIKFKELDDPEFVSSNVAYEYIPQMVLQFYEMHFKQSNIFPVAEKLEDLKDWILLSYVFKRLLKLLILSKIKEL